MYDHHSRRFGIRHSSLATLSRILPLLVFYTFFPTHLIAHGHIHDQIAHVSQLLKKDPQNASLFLKRGELHRHHRDWHAALTDYAEAARLDSDLHIVLLARGKLMLEAGRSQEAKTALDKFLARCPDHPEALVTRGRVLMTLGHNLAAADDFTLALGLSDPRPGDYIQRAEALVAAGPECIDEALRGLDEGLTKLGEIVTLELYAIELDLKSERYDAALARLERIAAHSPRKAKWLLRRGEILHKAGRNDEACAAFADALSELESLPSQRRGVKATVQLERRLSAAIDQLTGK